jgi:DNA-binding transcriptional regulator YhcF (GntR family)
VLLLRELRGDDPRAYVRLAVILRDLIATRQVKPGCPVPSIAALAREHGCARQTGSKAMRLLEGGGLLFLVPGLGYYVTEDAVNRLEGAARG